MSLALGEPRVAALGAEPFVRENGKFAAVPLPPALRPRDGERREARIFFGRDDRMRIMGTRTIEGRRSQLYLRWRGTQWVAERNEMAKLRDLPTEGLWGLLGHADPEVLCKIGDDCIVKRRSGWKLFAAGAEPARVELVGSTAWALFHDRVAKLVDDRKFVSAGPAAPFRDPGGVWAFDDDVWVSEPATGLLHRLRGGAWSTMASPTPEPRGLWGARADDLWLAGAAGLAHFDGTTWARVAGVEGPLAEVYGRGTEIWAAGASGVWSRGATSESAEGGARGGEKDRKRRKAAPP